MGVWGYFHGKNTSKSYDFDGWINIICTMKPVWKDHTKCQGEVVFLDRFSLYNILTLRYEEIMVFPGSMILSEGIF